MDRTIEDIGAKMNALGIWEKLLPYNFAVKPRGTVFPYFCTVLKGDRKPIKVRFLMLEGWQTLHDFVQLLHDRNYGFYLSPAEMPHFELLVLEDGQITLFRHDMGYVPIRADEAQRKLVAKILWEAYGVMMRLENDGKLPLRYASDKAIFARIENGDGTWNDGPLEVPNSRHHVEQVTFQKADIKAAKDLPIIPDMVIDVDFRIAQNIITKEKRPRFVYRLLAIDDKTNSTIIDSNVSMAHNSTLKELWESMPAQVLKCIVKGGKVPREIQVMSGRVFRLLRPICMELPIKLSMHDTLKALETRFQ